MLRLRYCAILIVLGITASCVYVIPDQPVILSPDLASYLAQDRCQSDGGPPIAVCSATPQRASDPMRWRRSDWPAPGRQIEDSVVSDDGSYFITTWSYPPHGPFRAENGDGGEVYTVRDGAAWICCTQDGSKPGITRFDGIWAWWLFDQHVAVGRWRTGAVGNRARARRETIAFPATGFGLREIVADTVISEMYYGVDHDGVGMERFYMGRGWGRLAWQAWSAPGVRQPTPDIAERCPAFPWSGPPDIHPDWALVDCRVVTNLVPADGSLSVAAYGWPPAGFLP